jgi:hypothetical protein
MRQNFGKAFLTVLFVLLLAATGLAQRQTGSIQGKALDQDKNPLPGVTVTLTGPALMGTKEYTTPETGNFRFSALSPGTYELRAVLSGFKTVIRPGVIVGVGRATDIDLILEVSPVSEEVTVTASSPVVDIRSTKMNVNLTANFLASLPLNRDLYDIQNSVPGAISEGVDYRRTSSILGGTVRSQLYALDGVPMNDPATFYSMANINVDVYEEIEFEVGGHPAEVGQTDSTYINIVTKSGGNRFSGGVTTYFTNKSLAQDLIPPETRTTFGVNAPEKYKDYKDGSFNLGGPILKDRLWFFLNGRRLVWGQANPLTPESRMARLNFTDSGKIGHYDVDHQEWMGFGKLTFQLAKNIKYMGMLHYNHIYEPVYQNSVGSDAPFEYTESWDHENTYTTTHQVNWILNQNTFLDIRGTFIHRYFPLISQLQNEATYYDDIQKVSWGASPYNDEYIRKKYLASASITRFADDFLGSSHEFKAGVEFEQSEYHRDWYRGNPYYVYYADYAKNNRYYYSNSKKQGRLRIRTCPEERGMWDVQDHVRRFSGYIQDSLTFGNFAINLGLRLDHSYQYEPEQTRPELRYDAAPPWLNPAITNKNALLDALDADWSAKGLGTYSPFDALTTPWKKVVQFTTLSPRLGVVWDIFGDGKTALKASFGRYYEPVWSAKYNGAQIFGASSINYYWNDLNGNKLMDLPPVDTYDVTSYPEQDPNFNYYPSDLKPPHMYEVIAGIEREIIKDFRLGFDFIWKQNKNIVDDSDLNNGYDIAATDSKGLIWIPFSFIDPGWDGLFGTGDDQTLTVYGLRKDRPIPTWQGGNPPEAKREYWAAILHFSKRMSNRWELEGSLLYSEFKGNTDAGYSATEGESGMFDSPNSLINAYGRIGFDRPFQFKLMGSYVLPYDFVISAYLQARSGSPWARTLDRVYFPANFAKEAGGVQQTYISAVNAELNGTRWNQPYTNIDLRLEKVFKLKDLAKLSLYVDVFNLAGRSGVNTNDNPYGRVRNDQIPVTYTLSSTYKLVTSIYGVRSVRVGARVTF